MMRWLKDKKKEKRSSSTGHEEDGKEDDYGFGKEKAASKSPSSRRELPPPPAAPEEKSPHIYEEIPDLSVACAAEGERASGQNKSSKGKNGGKSTGAASVSSSASLTLKKGVLDKDDISPYMVVPVDKEVRQTPTDFHRNGTPEVHCDVIIKDTHCEILFSRKPKVGAFRLDSSALTNGGEYTGDKKPVQNNTHFCSRNRRASVDVHSGEKMSSAFSMGSSAFSSTSKVNSVGASSSLSLSAFPEHHPMQTCEENDTGSAGSKGIVTYSAASNFIAKPTKLTFKPLEQDPCLEVFGAESGDEVVGYSSIRDESVGAASTGVSYTTVRDQNSGSKCVTYASIQGTEKSDVSNSDQVTYSAVQDQHSTDTNLKQKYCYDDQQSIFNPVSNSGFQGIPRTGIIHAPSPSNSSSCTYATVTFPVEPKLYNTIPDLIPSEFPSNDCNQHDGVAGESMGHSYCGGNGNSESDRDIQYNSDVCDGHKVNGSTYPGMNLRSNLNSCPNFDFDETMNKGPSTNGTRRASNNALYAGLGSRMRANNNNSMYSRVEQSNDAGFLSSSDHNGNHVHIEFCSCSDEHSSSCDCTSAKQNHDDDLASVRGAGNDGSGSCKSCGRLIRQITYSESYSDETYEHVYASRLLIRSGRRFSSPDITFSEVSNSEFPDIPNTRSPDFLQSRSRDDTWTSHRSADMIPPSYAVAAGESAFLDNNNGLPHLDNQKHDPVSEWCRRHWDSKSSRLIHLANSRLLPRQDAPSDSNCASMDQNTKVSGCHEPFSKSTTNKNHFMKESNNSCAASQKDAIYPGLSQKKHSKPLPADQKSRQSAVSLLEPRSTAFSGLFSKLSRNKPGKSTAKPESSEIDKCQITEDNNQIDFNKSVATDDKELSEIPERNTKKLSRFFQRLSSKDTPENSAVSAGILDNNDQFMASQLQDHATTAKRTPSFAEASAFKSVPADSAVGNSKQLLENQNTSSHLESGLFDEICPSKKQRESLENGLGIHTECCATQSQSAISEPPLSSPLDHQQTLAGCRDEGAAKGNTYDTSNTKPQNKTDSGDTCYEYDISTSSEGEQTSYDYFLSKVKKTLNLEHEVQHIAESSAARRRMLCKRCKRDGVYSTIDDEDEDVFDGVCPHLAAKFGDLRAMFEDMVADQVDQRAAILDCLTDYAHSPYNMKGHENHCRECGCEIMTSDSESLTTIYSLRSQQFRVTSPSRQTPSCDSDEGTMADNSCDSADDDCETHSKYNRNVKDGNISSGYDEPEDAKVERAMQKSRKKEKRDKRSASSLGPYKDTEKCKRKLTHSHCHSKSHQDSSGSSKVEFYGSSAIKQSLKDLSADLPRKTGLKKSTSLHSSFSPKFASGYHSTSDGKEDDLDHSGACEISRSRTSLLSDKALQDIYAPLPAKALSQLTSRTYGSPVGTLCTCGRGLQSGTTTHQGSGENTMPHKRRSHIMRSSVSQTLSFDSEKSGEGVRVQTHLDSDGKKKCDRQRVDGVEQFESKETRKSEAVKTSFHVEKDIKNRIYTVGKSGDASVRLGSRNKQGDDAILSHADGGSFSERYASTKDSVNNDRTAPTISSLQDQQCISQSAGRDGNTQTLDTNSFPKVTDDKDNKLGTKEHDIKATYETPSVAGNNESFKLKNIRKNKLELATLDLLPESAVDGDVSEVTHTGQTHITQPKRSRVVEKMAKLFESQAQSTSNNGKPRSSSSDDTKYETRSLKDMKGNPRDCQSSTAGQSSVEKSLSGLIPDVAETFSQSANSLTPQQPTQDLLGLVTTQRTRLANQCNSGDLPRSRNLNFNEKPSAFNNTSDLPTPKTHTSATGSKQDKENGTKSRAVKTDNENGANTKRGEMKNDRGKTSRSKSSPTQSGDAKLASPTPSSSSVSSSSSSKKKAGGQVKNKKISKKSYQKKRSKSRSERNKSAPGREERTYYYFSSDFSDIDVVEVEDWETYATGLNPTSKSPHSHSHGKKTSTGRRKKSHSHSDTKNHREGEKLRTTSMPVVKTDTNTDNDYEQEIYAMPPSSSELRHEKETNEGGASPQPSPEMTKARQSKRLDVYKTRKSNNKLLSDLIIRNYDMQVYGNV